MFVVQHYPVLTFRFFFVSRHFSHFCGRMESYAYALSRPSVCCFFEIHRYNGVKNPIRLLTQESCEECIDALSCPLALPAPCNRGENEKSLSALDNYFMAATSKDSSELDGRYCHVRTLVDLFCQNRGTPS